MNLKNKKILITGTSGFIGSHLVEELSKKNLNLRALVRYNSRNDWGKLEELPKNILNNIEVVTGD
ncbi:MAG: GDP-mannose 4,6-dehydratase, partial [Endomicrobiia bacterium]